MIDYLGPWCRVEYTRCSTEPNRNSSCLLFMERLSLSGKFSSPRPRLFLFSIFATHDLTPPLLFHHLPPLVMWLFWWDQYHFDVLVVIWSLWWDHWCVMWILSLFLIVMSCQVIVLMWSFWWNYCVVMWSFSCYEMGSIRCDQWDVKKTIRNI